MSTNEETPAPVRLNLTAHRSSQSVLLFPETSLACNQARLQHSCQHGYLAVGFNLRRLTLRCSYKSSYRYQNVDILFCLDRFPLLVNCPTKVSLKEDHRRTKGTWKDLEPNVCNYLLSILILAEAVLQVKLPCKVLQRVQDCGMFRTIA